MWFSAILSCIPISGNKKRPFRSVRILSDKTKKPRRFRRDHFACSSTFHETVVSAFRPPHTQFHESLRLQFPFPLLPASASQWLPQCSVFAFASSVFPVLPRLVSRAFLPGSGTQLSVLPFSRSRLPRSGYLVHVRLPFSLAASPWLSLQVPVTWLVRFELFSSAADSHTLPPEPQFVNAYFLSFSTIVLYFTTNLFL